MNGGVDEECELHVVELTQPNSCCYFESAKDYNRLCFLMLMCVVTAVILVWTSALTMCSSNYILSESKLDVLILSADILSIDLFSCSFVLCGYTASFVYMAIGSRQWAILQSQMCWSCYAIGLSSNLLSAVTGSMWKAYLGKLHAADVFLTVVEGVTSVRLLDVNQNSAHMHSLNLFVWPVLIMLWCLISVEYTWKGNGKIVNMLPQHGYYLLVVLALCGICLFTLFGMMHSATNIFYANATSVAYRTLEFNFGVHMHFLQQAEFRPLLDVMQVLRQCRLVIVFVFCATWWTEIGVVVQDNSAVCLRLYSNNNCLRDHHAFLLRGCVLGATLISSVDDTQNAVVSLPNLLSALPVVPSALALCCPIFSIAMLIFVFTFSKALVFANIACVALVLTVLLWLLSYIYSVQILPHVRDALQTMLQNLISALQSKYSAVRDNHGRTQHAENGIDETISN